MKKVNKIFALLMLVILVSPAFNSCKKGENDPAISLKSRDGRLAQTWKLTGIEGTIVSTYGGDAVTTTYAFDGSIFSQTSTPGGTSTATGTYEMIIEKNGNMSFAETLTPSNGTADIATGEGHWQWIDSDKNKSFLIIDGGSNIFSGGLLYVDRLAGSELVLKETTKNTTNSNTSSTDLTYTFEKQ